jgi:hypothetical protein
VSGARTSDPRHTKPTAEQRALLQLLCGRGLSLEEVDATLGEGEGAARERARAAATALVGTDPGERVTSYVLGSAGAAEQERTRTLLRRDRRANELARKLATALTDEIEGAVPPEIPALSNPWRRRATLALGGLAAIGVGLGAGAIVEGGSDEPASLPEEPVAGAADPSSEPQSVRIELAATDPGGDASGSAVVGLDEQFEPYLQLDLANLPPAAPGSIYVPWIDLGNGTGVPVPTPLERGQDGSVSTSLDLAPALISVLDVGRDLQVLAIDAAELRDLTRQVEAAGERSSSGGEDPGLAPRSPGGAVLSGRIPDR